MKLLILEKFGVFDPVLPLERAGVEPMPTVFPDDFVKRPSNAFRRLTPADIELEVAAQLAAGLIEEVSDAPNPAAVVMVKKPDSVMGYRFTVDYSAKNKGLV